MAMFFTVPWVRAPSSCNTTTHILLKRLMFWGYLTFVSFRMAQTMEQVLHLQPDVEQHLWMTCIVI